VRNLWTLGGLSLPELLRRTIRESWQDEVFGQGGRMSFYHFLAIFPSIVVFLAFSARIPHLGDQTKGALQDLSRQLLPSEVSRLMQSVLNDLSGRSLAGMRLVIVCAGALWAALNGTWAMIWGLNRAYEVEEHRSWRDLAVTICGLTGCLAFISSFTVFVFFSGSRFQNEFRLGVRILEWIVLAVALSLAFAVLYRFGPSVRDAAWRWNTPGVLCALILWIGSTFGARFYFDHVSDYSRSYGPLNGVAMLLLWLYVMNGAILIGGEMNSEIQKTIRQSIRDCAAR
jgi:membrane protein